MLLAPLGLWSAQGRHARAVLAALRAAGATSPANAQPAAAIPALVALSAAEREALVAGGDVREGAPGTYYLYERAGRRGRRLLILVVVWIALIVIPVLLIQVFGI